MLDAKFFINELIALSIALCFFIGILYIIVKIEKNQTVINWMQRKLNMYLIYSLIGVIVGFISVILNLIQRNVSTEYSFTVDIAFILVCGFFTSPIIFISSTIVYIASSFLFDVANISEYELLSAYALIIYVSIALVLVILKVLNVSKFWIFYLTAIPVAAMSLAFGWLFIPHNVWEIAVILPFLTLAYIIIYYLVGIPIVNFIGKTKQLAEAVKFNSHKFILPAHANDFLLDNVKNFNVTRGLFIIFNFKGSKEIKFNEGAIKYNQLIAPLLEMIKSKVKIAFPDIQPVWFLSRLNYHGVFIPIKNSNHISLDAIYAGNNNNVRLENDIFSRCDDIFKKIPYQLCYENQIYKFDIQATGSVYGLHSSSFDKLNLMSEILMDEYEKKRYKNLIHVYNPNDFKSIEYDAEVYADLVNRIDVNSISTELNLLKCDAEPKTNFYYGFHAIPQKLILNKWSILNSVPKNQNKAALMRLFAVRSIKIFNEKFKNNKNNKKLIIDFPMYQLNVKYFSIDDMMLKLKYHNISLDNLIINIAFDMEENSGLTPTDINNIHLLKKQGIKLSVSGFYPENIDILKDIDIDYVIGNYIINFEKFRLRSESEVKLISKNVIKMKSAKILYLFS